MLEVATIVMCIVIIDLEKENFISIEYSYELL